MKFVPHADTYLNNRRWEDVFSIMENRIPVSEQWMVPMLEKLSEQQGQEVLKMKKTWESKQKKDITPGVFQNLINHVICEESE